MKKQIYNTALYLRLSRDDELQGESSSTVSYTHLMLREFLEKDEERSILISSHISIDLESLCDDLYMIHDGKIILHEDTDVLLSDLSLIHI